jgi:hypothetical protein
MIDNEIDVFATEKTEMSITHFQFTSPYFISDDAFVSVKNTLQLFLL